MPRPEAKIDLVEMEKLCNLQCTDEEIAAFFGVSVRTIERKRKNARIAEVMERGRAKGRLSVRRMLFRQGNNGNVAAAIFLSKNVLGYRDVINTEHTGLGGGPIRIEARPDYSRLSDEEIRQLRLFAEKTKPPEGD